MILTAGLSPAWQQVLRFDGFYVDQVNRAQDVHWCASGKTTNAALASWEMGADIKMLTIIGGNTGRDFRRHIESIGLPSRWIPGLTETRICTTVVDQQKSTTTELVQNSPSIDAGELQCFVDAFVVESRRASTIVLSGSLPAGTPAGFFASLLAGTSAKTILDIRGHELLETLSYTPFVVKPNLDELRLTLQKKLEDTTEILAAMQLLNERGAQWVIVTDGARPFFVSSLNVVYRVHPLATSVVNPIGCGDCFTGAFAAAIDRQETIESAICFGVAAATDSARGFLPADLKRERVTELQKRVQLEEV